MPAGPVVVIVNPRSQNGALGRQWPEMARTLRRTIGSFEDAPTRRPGHAPALVREALACGAKTIVAVGGDGTLHEVANGFFDAEGRLVTPDAALGFLPFGTGGDFRRTARIPADLEAAAHVLAGATPRSIDVGALEYREGGRGGPRARRLFVNIASFGIAGLVDRIVNASSKALGGRLSFVLGTARAALRYRNQRVRMTFDEADDSTCEATIHNVAVANGRYFGGGMQIAPHARLDDGHFDVIVLGDLSRLDLLTQGPRVYQGTHLSLDKVTFRRARHVRAEAVDPGDEVLLDVDGESPGALPATFTLLPRALPMLLPHLPDDPV